MYSHQINISWSEIYLNLSFLILKNIVLKKKKKKSIFIRNNA